MKNMIHQIKRFAGRMLLLAGVLVAGRALADGAASGQPTLRILPLGDSITAGSGSLGTGGYRGPLWAQLTSAGYAVEFVGTQTTSPTGEYAEMSKPHEGHGGVRITDSNGDRLGVLDCLPAWMAKVETPDVVLLHLGTNDSAEPDFGERGVLDMEKLLELVRGIAPKAHVVLSTLMWRDNATYYANIQAFNSRLAGLVTLQRKRGQKISLVDMHAQVPGGEANFTDGLHPNATGYGLMANAWLAAVEAIYPDPQTLVEAPVDVVPSTDAYIESHGDRSVNLGYYMTTKSRIEVDFQYPNKPTDSTVLFGPYGGSAKLTTLFWTTRGVFGFSYGDSGHRPSDTSVTSDTTRHTAVIDVLNNELRLEQNGAVQWKKNPTDPHVNDAAWPIVLFGATADSDGSGKQFVSARVHSVKIYENEVLVHDFIPAVNGAEAGFLDMVTGSYKGSSGTGAALTASEGAVPAGDASTDPYVESEGGASVNLNYFMTTKSRVEVDFQYPNKPANSTILFGPYDSGAKLSTMSYNINNVYGFSYGDNGHHPIVSSVACDTARHKVVIDVLHNELRLEQDGHLQWQTNPTSDHNNNAAWPLVLFGATANAAGESKQEVSARVFSVKIYENDEIKHDFRPCVKGLDVGFLDKETGAFVSSDKDLIASDNCERILDDTYIESVADKTINTGYFMTTDSRIEVDFQYPNTPVNSTVLFGPYHANAKLTTLFWAVRNVFGFSYGDGGHHAEDTTIASDTRRHTAVIDVLHNEIRLERNGRVQWKKNPTTAHVNNAAWPIVIFGATASAAGAGTQPSKARIYSVKVYEKDAIVHEWVASVVNGVPMLVDKCGGPSLYHTDSLKNPDSPFKAGGVIESDAYVESDGTQVLNTGYFMTPKSRIEVDFQYPTLPANSSVLFGPYDPGAKLSSILWTVRNVYGFSYGDNGHHAYDTSVASDTTRHTAVIDFPNNEIRLEQNGEVQWKKNPTNSHANDAAWPIVLFGATADAAGGSKQWVSARIYSVKIYEDGELVRNFLPYKNGDEVGLRDALTGALALKTSQGNIPKIGGCGFGPEHAAFFEEPVGGMVRSRGKTLSAFAPGAIGYQWYKDGEAIPGAVLRTLKVDWQDGAPSAAYSVKAIFDSFGMHIEKMSRSVDVEMAPVGFRIIIR